MPSEPFPKKPTLVIATGNAHKVQEIRAILGDRFLYLSLVDLPAAPKVIEDAPSFVGNATKKAVTLAKWVAANGTQGVNPPSATLFVLADDSGLEVDAIGGAPGVHSARFAGHDSGKAGNSSDVANNAKLMRLLNDVPQEKRTARFRCVLALTPITSLSPENASPVCYTDEMELQTQTFEGVCEGKIGLGPKGQGGFGYDPLFIPSGFDQTYAELGEQTKNTLSHRAKALAKLRQHLSR